MILEAEILEAAEMCGLDFIKRNGDEVIYRCPFCGDRRGHLYLNPTKNVYHCVRCGEGGYAVGMVARVFNISKSEAARMLNSKTRGWDFSLGYKARKKEREAKLEVKDEDNNIAPIEVRHRVYSTLLDIFDLSEKHKKNLLERGLPENVIERNGYKTLATDPQMRKNICRYLSKVFDLSRIPGFYKDGDEWDYIDTSGIVIPVRDLEGRIQGLQIRRDTEERGKYRWFSASKKGGQKAKNFAHVAYGRNNNETVVITEGPLKADIASYYTGYTFIAVPGVSSWKEAIKTLKEMVHVRRVLIAFDMDYRHNAAVEKCMRNLYDELITREYRVKILTWDIRLGKGIDDYVVRRRNS